MHSCVYLCGAMEFADDGASWRDLASVLLGREGYSVWNPYDHESKVVVPSGLDLANLDKERDFDLFRRYMKRIIRLDLDALMNEADVVLARVDEGLLSGAGSIAEMSISSYYGKKVHVWLDGVSLNDLPAWLCGTIDTYAYSLHGAIANLISCV